MPEFVIDTSIVIWYFLNSPHLSQAANVALDDAVQNGGSLYIPTISVVELTYLIEKNRIPPDVLTLLNSELRLPNTIFETQPLTKEISDMLGLIPRSTVPEMPDRIIATTALFLGLPLITSDSAIRQLTNLQSIW
jgi:PIN domain nuclease of toxin-antitoxin system